MDASKLHDDIPAPTVPLTLNQLMKMGGDSVMARDVKNKTMILFLPNCRPKINAVGGHHSKWPKIFFPQITNFQDL